MFRACNILSWDQNAQPAIRVHAGHSGRSRSSQAPAEDTDSAHLFRCRQAARQRDCWRTIYQFGWLRGFAEVIESTERKQGIGGWPSLSEIIIPTAGGWPSLSEIIILTAAPSLSLRSVQHITTPGHAEQNCPPIATKSQEVQTSLFLKSLETPRHMT